MKEVTLQLTVQEVNTILTALAKMPYESVNTIIGKIYSEAQEQIKENDDTTSDTNEP